MKTLVPDDGELLGGRGLVDFSERCQNGLPHDKYIAKATDTLILFNEFLNDELTKPLPLEEFRRMVAENKQGYLESFYNAMVFLLNYTTIYRQIYDKLKENLSMALIQHHVKLEEQIKELDQNYV